MFRLDLVGRATLAVFTTGDVDTVGVLYDNAANVLDEDDDGGGGLNFRMERTLDGGVHYVSVASMMEVGDYRITARIVHDGDAHGDTPGASTLLPLDTRMTGRIAPSDDLDAFRLDLAHSMDVRISTGGPGDTTGELRDSTDAALTATSIGGADDNFRIDHCLDAGIYYLLVSARDVAPYNVVAVGTPRAHRCGVDDNLAALTDGLPERPFVDATVGGTEGSTRTVGTLRVADLDNDVTVVLAVQGDMELSVLAAASFLGTGRVVAFSGQDFLGSSERATLVGRHANADRLLLNAVRWAGGDRGPPLRVVVDNPQVAAALKSQGFQCVEVVGAGLVPGTRDWNAEVLEDAHVAVVQVNEWGTARLLGESAPALRAFVERGGGLVIAGSALHWSWWMEGARHGPAAGQPFPGNDILRGTGISWNVDAVARIADASTRPDLSGTSALLWREYLRGSWLDAVRMSRLPPLFGAALETGRIRELNTALARLVRDAPSLPTSSAVPEARLAAEVGETLGPHDWPEPHPWATVFPGLPAEGANRADRTVAVDASRREFPANAARRERHLPIGYYAPPGASVTVEMPDHAIGRLEVSVGEAYDRLWHLDTWRRAPALRRVFRVASRDTIVTNAYGGSIALVVPADFAARLRVTVRGAIPMAMYTAGESNDTDWLTALDSGAPQAIIQRPGGIRLVVLAGSARGITEPGQVSAFWDEFLRHHRELAGEPYTRAYESTWIFDPQVGWGYANATSLRINYPLHGERWALVPGTTEGRAWLSGLPDAGPQPTIVPPPEAYIPSEHGVDWWLFGHELGHQWQTADWRGDVTEVAVNLFTMYTINKHIFRGGEKDIITVDREGLENSVDHAALAEMRWPTAGFYGKLQMYRQLVFEFGWTPIKAVFRSYYDPDFPRTVYGSYLDGFAIRFSAIVERDLTDFFRHWEYPLSDSAAATIRSFGLEPWLPPGW